jgi:lipopolysaccharide/colanic/teichoic acid biosynthesis glycosyltransferase
MLVKGFMKVYPDKEGPQNSSEENCSHQIQRKPRYVPLFRNARIRMAIGFFLLALSLISVGMTFDKGRIEFIALITVFAWIISTFFTDKYVHKYPQRYFSYLIASHAKAAIIMALVLWPMGLIAGPRIASSEVLWTGFLLFISIDVLVSFPYRLDISDKLQYAVNNPPRKHIATYEKARDSDSICECPSLIDSQTIIKKIPHDLDESLFEFIKNNLPDHMNAGDILVLDDISDRDNMTRPASVALLIGRTRINDVLRLNNFMKLCTEHISMGGYFVIRYMPLENVVNDLRKRYPGLLFWPVYVSHFIWYRAIPKIPWLEKLYFSPLFRWLDAINLSLIKKRNRALAKAEVWGRLSFYGMNVQAESKGDGELYIIAQRVAMPVQNKTPSFYLIASLEKVGLDGKNIKTHKIRTMYPFSEFLQKRVFEDHGLAATGKFANDFRLTDYGRFLRKYWLDELPQIFDWLRGDVKLVGMRATSPHFLSLYPKELYDLYIQIKPGLIPPIFDESTAGFDDIIRIELTYLQSYWTHPVRTDIRCLIGTFTDIVFRGVRSK